MDAGVSPRGAFLRAIGIPSWGHAAIGSNLRGAFYLAAEGGTLWMMLRTRSRLHDARRIRDLREEAARARFLLEGVTDEAEIEALLENDERVDDARDLVDARSQQFEDWTALGIFLVLLSGADALVSAHLQDFPGPVQLEATPTGDGGVDLGVRITLPNR